ncbi:MAG: toprim domain-containing protein [Henriciella sp.]|nr:toprim domain-containing protein [Henriciella sp.]
MEARRLTAVLGGTWRNGRGIAPCPVEGHGRGRGDKNPSLSVAPGHRRPVVFHCHAGCSQTEVLEALKRRGAWPPGGETCVLTTLPARKRPRPVSNLADAEALWASALPLAGTSGFLYLEKRQIAGEWADLGYRGACKHPHAGIYYPVMLAAVRRCDGSLCAVQRTFITEGGYKADVKPVRLNTGALTDGAVQLVPPGKVLGLAEGVETAMSAMNLFNLPVWAACGLRFDRIRLPEIVQDVVLFADHDPPGLEHAQASKRYFEQLGYSVSLRFPEPSGADWNDVLLLKSGGWQND